VQAEDIHPANVIPALLDLYPADPVVSQWYNVSPVSGQVRHFMRSSESISSEGAFRQSKAYISGNLTDAWSKFRQALDRQDNQSSDDVGPGHSLWVMFMSGNDPLAKALHTIEDSYAPGHVTRASGLGCIQEVHIWDEDNKNANADTGWPGHHALDEPTAAQSAEFYDMARSTAGDLILCVLANLDQDNDAFRQDLASKMDKYFYMAQLAPPDTPDASGGDTGVG
jgi:hypothetical protein